MSIITVKEVKPKLARRNIELVNEDKFIKMQGVLNTLRCKNCGYTWEVKNLSTYTADKAKSKSCPKCSRKVQDEGQRIKWAKGATKAIYNISKYIQITSIKDAKTPIEVHCNNCGFNYSINWPSGAINLTVKKVSCPRCSLKESSGERTVRLILEYNGIEYSKEYAYNNEFLKGRTQRLDYYLPTYNLAIEIQGNQHFNQRNGLYNVKDAVKRDKAKADWCNKQGIRLLYIYYREDAGVSMFSQMIDSSCFVSLKQPPESYMRINDSGYNEVLDFIKSGGGLDEASAKFNIGVKVINRYIKMAGYKNFFELHNKARLEKLGLTDDKIVDFLKTHTLGEVTSKLGIPIKYVKNHIFNSDNYSFSSMKELHKLYPRAESYSEDFINNLLDYGKTHHRIATEKYFKLPRGECKRIFGDKIADTFVTGPYRVNQKEASERLSKATKDNLSIISGYTGCSEPCILKCNLCGNEFMGNISRIESNARRQNYGSNGCPKCSRSRRGVINAGRSKGKTNEEIKQALIKKGLTWNMNF